MLAGFEEYDFLKEENIAMWEKFHSFPIKIQQILKSDQITDMIFGVEKKYQLSDLDTEKFSIMVRGFFLREISERDFIQNISVLCRVQLEESMQVLRAILSIEPQEEKEKLVKKNVMQTTITNAFSQFPAVKNQMISDKLIIARPFLQPLQPSIKNWIMVYEKVLGANKHSAIERGEFVFRSEATRGLNSQERDELAAVLRSRDEDSSITVDMDQRKIIFEEEKRQIEPIENQQRPTYYPPKPAQQFVRQPKQQSVTQVGKKEDVVMDRNITQKELMTQKPFQKEYVAPVPNVAQSALQQEIAKNRMEIEQGLSVVNFSERSGTIMPTVKEQMSVQKMEQIPAAVTFVPSSTQDTNTVASGISTVQNNSAIIGKVEFSSNHNLPVEKIEKKSLNSTSDYYQMSPIGGAHVFEKKD